MLRKIVTTIVLLAVSSFAVASNSVYVGLGSGITTNTSKNADGSPGFFRGIPLNVFVGYSTVIDPDLYIAGEINGTIGTGEITNKGNMKTSYGYGIGILPGILLGEHSVMFARFGLVRTEFTTPKDMRTGGQLGLGMESSLTQNIELRGEYVFTAYSDVGTIKSPRQDTFLASLVYRFD